MASKRRKTSWPSSGESNWKSQFGSLSTVFVPRSGLPFPRVHHQPHPYAPTHPLTHRDPRSFKGDQAARALQEASDSLPDATLKLNAMTTDHAMAAAAQERRLLLILLSNKSEPPTMLKSLALAMEDQVAVGFYPNPDPQTMERFQVRPARVQRDGRGHPCGHKSLPVDILSSPIPLQEHRGSSPFTTPPPLHPLPRCRGFLCLSPCSLRRLCPKTKSRTPGSPPVPCKSGSGRSTRSCLAGPLSRG